MAPPAAHRPVALPAPPAQPWPPLALGRRGRSPPPLPPPTRPPTVLGQRRRQQRRPGGRRRGRRRRGRPPPSASSSRVGGARGGLGLQLHGGPVSQAGPRRGGGGGSCPRLTRRPSAPIARSCQRRPRRFSALPRLPRRRCSRSPGRNWRLTSRPAEPPRPPRQPRGRARAAPPAGHAGKRSPQPTRENPSFPLARGALENRLRPAAFLPKSVGNPASCSVPSGPGHHRLTQGGPGESRLCAPTSVEYSFQW